MPLIESLAIDRVRHVDVIHRLPKLLQDIG